MLDVFCRRRRRRCVVRYIRPKRRSRWKFFFGLPKARRRNIERGNSFQDIDQQKTMINDGKERFFNSRGGLFFWYSDLIADANL